MPSRIINGKSVRRKLVPIVCGRRAWKPTAITIVTSPARRPWCCGFGSGASGADTVTSASVACRSSRNRIGRSTLRPLPRGLTAKPRRMEHVGADSFAAIGGALRRTCRCSCGRSATRLARCRSSPRPAASGVNCASAAATWPRRRANSSSSSIPVCLALTAATSVGRFKLHEGRPRRRTVPACPHRHLWSRIGGPGPKLLRV